MRMHREDLETILRNNKGRIVVATRNPSGVPNLAPEFAVHWDDDAIVFAKFPGGDTLANIAAVPEVAVSVVDWVQCRGLQLKGVAQLWEPSGDVPLADPVTARRMRALGARHLVRIEVMEVYDVAPKDGQYKPLWQRRRDWVHSAVPPKYVTPKHTPRAMDSVLLAELRALHTALLTSRTPSFLATVGSDGVVNVSPRFLLEIGDSYWLYGDAFKNKTFMNAGRPSAVALAMVDWDREQGVQARGWAEPKFSGEWLLKVRDSWERLGFRQNLIQAVVFHAEEVDRLALGARLPLFQAHPRADWYDAYLAA